MIKIHFIDGYKYIGDWPDYLPGVTDLGALNESRHYTNYRDNITYCCFQISDWIKDKQGLLFILSTHVSWIGSDAEEYLDQFIGSYVVENKTPKLYLLVKQDSIETKGNLTFSVTSKVFKDHFDILDRIQKRKEFYLNLDTARENWMEELLRAKAKKSKKELSPKKAKPDKKSKK